MASVKSVNPIMRLFLNIRTQLMRQPKSVWFKLPFYPFLLAASTLFAWPASIKKSFRLFYGKWERYHGFTAFNSINSLFYRTQWLNINSYGRDGVSPTFGLGHYPLNNIWHLSTLASYFYAHAGAITTLLGVIWMTLGNLIWLEVSAHPLWVLFVTALFFFSSTAYLMAFERQNYQILGWSWLPICFFGFLTQHYFIAAGSFLIASTLSLTAFVTCLPILFIYSFFKHDAFLIFSIFPAILVTSSKLLYIFSHEKTLKAVFRIADLVGASKKNVRYKRANKLGGTVFYFLVVYLLSIILLWLGKGGAPYLALYALTIFYVNHRLIRFADIQSTILLFTFMALSEAIISEPNYLITLGLLVACNPLNNLLALVSDKWFSVSTYQPFDLTPILDSLRGFLQVPKSQKILIVFSDPDDQYEKIFDEDRVLVEAAFYVAAEKGVHLFPDWHAILETNYQGSPSFWGREPEQVIFNMCKFNLKHALIYQDAGTPLEDKWSKNFKLISEYDWTTNAPEVAEEFFKYRKKELPKWFLLKIK